MSMRKLMSSFQKQEQYIVNGYEFGYCIFYNFLLLFP